MRLLICGSRNWPDPFAVEQAVWELDDETIVVSGMAAGPDTTAAMVAAGRGLWVIRVPVERQHWREFGRSAGHRRNTVMLDVADAVLAFNAGTPGTTGCVLDARRRGLPVDERRP